MPRFKLPRFRFSLKTLLILSIGVAIGYTLNLRTWQILTGAASEARKMSLPTYVIEPPDVLRIEAVDEAAGASPIIAGEHRVAMDGRVNLGAHGSAYVAGMTMAEATEVIAKKLARTMSSPKVWIDVTAYNSKAYYIVIRSNSGLGDDVTRMPVTGNDTVLDAVANVGGLSLLTNVRLSLARPNANGFGQEQILAVDWPALSTGADATSNYQLLPGDRLIIEGQFPAKASAAAPSTPAPANQQQIQPASYHASDLPDYYQYVRPQLEAAHAKQLPNQSPQK